MAKPKKTLGIQSSIQPEWPVWYSPQAPLGGVTRYIASLSPEIDWVAIYLFDGKSYKLGPSIGNRKGKLQTKTTILKQLPSSKDSSLRTIPIRNKKGIVVAGIEIQSAHFSQLSQEAQDFLLSIASELEAHWDIYCPIKL